MQSSTVVIIGAGELGNAIKQVLEPNPDLAIHTWNKDPAKHRAVLTLPEMIGLADVVFLTVPSSAISIVAKTIAKHLRPSCIVISLAKGLDLKTGNTTDAVLKQHLPAKQPFAILGGPMLAEELCQGGYGYAAIGTTSKQVAADIHHLFRKSLLGLFPSTDVRGVAAAGVLKNIYAISLGVIAEMKWCQNERGWLIQQCCAEMATALPLLGGRAATAYTVAGMGDLLATGSSIFSSNYRYGQSLINTKLEKPHCEGAVSLPMLVKRLKNRVSGFPILTALSKVILKKYNAYNVFDNLRTQR